MVSQLLNKQIFLSEFMIKYNQKFGVSPEDATPAFRALGESINLDYILCIKRNV